MPTFKVEIVHEATGTYMNFTTDLDNWDDENPITEEEAWQYIMDDLSIICEEVVDV